MFIQVKLGIIILLAGKKMSRKVAKEQLNLIYFFNHLYKLCGFAGKKCHAKSQRRKGTAEFSLFF